jgi:hypothetical protein
LDIALPTVLEPSNYFSLLDSDQDINQD